MSELYFCPDPNRANGISPHWVLCTLDSGIYCLSVLDVLQWQTAGLGRPGGVFDSSVINRLIRMLTDPNAPPIISGGNYTKRRQDDRLNNNNGFKSIISRTPQPQVLKRSGPGGLLRSPSSGNPKAPVRQTPGLRFSPPTSMRCSGLGNLQAASTGSLTLIRCSVMMCFGLAMALIIPRTWDSSTKGHPLPRGFHGNTYAPISGALPPVIRDASLSYRPNHN